MTDRRAWTEEQDSILKFIFQTCKMNRWSLIARKMQEEYGFKGRNGKQCKDRFVSHIDPHYFKQQWSEAQDHKMMELHNQLGNKWAIIGSTLGDKSDNCVKNRFYSKLRKGLKKLNQIISLSKDKQYKDIKANSLYRIVQVAQQNFKLINTHDRQFSSSANQLKKELFDFANAGEMDDQNQDEAVYYQKGEELIIKMHDFVNMYKRRNKKSNKKQAESHNLLTPSRCNMQKVKQNADEESSGSGEINVSSVASNISDISDDQISRQNKQRKKRRGSMQTGAELLINKRMMTRASSQGNLQNSDKISENCEKMQDEEKSENQISKKQQLRIQNMLGQLDIMQQQIQQNPLFLKKNSSKYSYNSQKYAQEQAFYFFQDSQMNVRIFPEVLLMNNRDSQHEENLF